jgi:glutamyl-tRNA synthetase
MRLLVEANGREPELVTNAITLEQERVTSVAEFATACQFFFVDEVTMDEKAVEKWKGQPHVLPMLEDFIEFFQDRAHASIEECEALLRDYQSKAGIEKLGPVVHPTRVALTGKTVGPGLFELMAALGPARIVKRLERAKGILA